MWHLISHVRFIGILQFSNAIAMAGKQTTQYLFFASKNPYLLDDPTFVVFRSAEITQ